ncbi:hypothetical protein CTAYLR_005433 [Chrysophaeum taylorii]|uniref:AB hydrolase-1 domain-containing protein n=1 Tax=Chrysophaeum taylorii TaxID=2483200 RepID=A0AAD7UKF3_9STRA|nr:hypothetical protein CTAYLR_005433 [Chrysophaeum taylorii]
MTVSERRRGADYELLLLRPQQQTKQRQVTLFLPGNPGLVDFYEPMCRDLVRLTATPVVVVGYRGFASSPPRNVWPLPSFDLESQIAHARRVLDDVAREHDAVALVGHSIGALIALDILATEEKVRAVAAMMPFVAANDASPTYRAKRAIATFPGVRLVFAFLAACLRILPAARRSALMAALGQPTKNMSESARMLAVDAMTRPYNLHAMIAMGASEFRSQRIIEGPDEAWRHRAASVGVVYATGRDDWVKDDAPAEMRRRGVETHFVEADHDFCTRTETSASCARTVASIIATRM